MSQLTFSFFQWSNTLRRKAAQFILDAKIRGAHFCLSSEWQISKPIDSGVFYAHILPIGTHTLHLTPFVQRRYWERLSKPPARSIVPFTHKSFIIISPHVYIMMGVTRQWRSVVTLCMTRRLLHVWTCCIGLALVIMRSKWKEAKPQLQSNSRTLTTVLLVINFFVLTPDASLTIALSC